MSTYLSAHDNENAPPGAAMAHTTGNPLGQAAQQSAAQAMEFQLWVSSQASTLAKLKIFNAMAKSVNDQS